MTNASPAMEPRLPWPIEIVATALVVAVSTGIAWLVAGRESPPDVVLLQLLGVVAVSIRFRFAASILAAVLSVAAYDFFFLPPYFSLRVYEVRHLVTFGVMFVVGVVISTLTRRIRDQAASARAREDRTARLYAMTRELSSARAQDRLGEIAASHLTALVEGDAEILLTVDPEEGAGEARKAVVLPLVGSRGEIGALRVVPRVPERFADPEQHRLLEAFAALIAGALERARSAGEAEAARLETEAERLQSSLLSSVSHDLRTPLAVITGAASTLLSADPPLSAPAQRDLCAVIYEESVRLTRLVGNLLDMTRLAAGAVKVGKEWQSVEGVVGAAIARVEERLDGRPLDVQIPADLPIVPIDAVLVEQVLINLLENAAKYAPEGAPVEVRAEAGAAEVVLSVADRGPGVPAALRRRIFDKFYRVPGARGGGAGLGLAICRAIVEAHGGRIEVLDREGGGSVFRFSLPVEGPPPSIEEDGGAS